ncbi:MAG: Gfo/Idh/MocA family oxidoreductase [Pseudomonadota bacterium]
MAKRVAALIGAGMVARTHLAAIQDCADLTLGAVVARSAESAARLADEAEALMGTRPTASTDLQSVAADPKIDLCVIVTPPDARADIVGPFARAGKAILLEKPIGRDLTEAVEIVALCEAQNVPLGVVLQHRMREASEMARAVLPELGPIGLIEISVPWWREQSYYDTPGRGTYARDGGGVLINQAIHTLDLALHLAGPVTQVTAMTGTTRLHRMEAEDVAAAGLTFESGALGWLTASTASFPGAAESIVMHGQAGTLRLAEGVCAIDWRDGRQERHGAAAATGGGADPMAFTHAWHRAVLRDFLDALDEGRPPAITGRDALAVHALIEAITVSARRGHAMPVEPAWSLTQTQEVAAS